MAHSVRTRRLGRSRSWRKATVRSLAQALIRWERIQTTRAKAKEAQRLVEHLITLGKRGTLADRRRAMAILNHAPLVHRLFDELAPRFQNRAGGYTRIIANGFRRGDGASLAILELVESAPKPTPSKATPQRRGFLWRRRSSQDQPSQDQGDTTKTKTEKADQDRDEKGSASQEAKTESSAFEGDKSTQPMTPSEPTPSSEEQEDVQPPGESADKRRGFLGGLRKFLKGRREPESP
jgi:large subunit ribosomal protein L17